ncbi:hypothetical protein [Acinetobacter larvae]|uniref:Type IV secretion protein Rhs n=1 Tax=Acinetobacter larvae TaxID=1789224 RepID=A0A1B2LXW1_9GAMM|nr:hypothetical protein [Acinetobacter larvae]AOA57788.1 hypothetical protein BFG52_05095 [Acinetobacter larvae]
MLKYLIAYCIPYLKLTQFTARQLTHAERQLCQTVFGQLIDYDQVYIFKHRYLPWQSEDIFMAPNGNLYILDKHFKADYALEDIAYQAIFIHEMTHVYQYQQGKNVLFHGALLQIAYYISAKRYNPYHYQLAQRKAFHNYNIEQQGDIARDIFLKKIKNIII